MILVNKMKFKPFPTINRIKGLPGGRQGVVYSRDGSVEVSEHITALDDHDWIYISFDTVINVGGLYYCYFYTYKTTKFYTDKGLAQVATKWLNKLYWEM